MSLEISDERALKTFDECAAFYDALTADHDSELWMGNLEGLARRHGLSGRSLLDVACGTGKSFLPLMRRGYSVTGCDQSAAMLELARAKAGSQAELCVADMRELPRLGSYDLITCIDEPINYLLEPGDLEATFRSARANLAPDGIYLFDLNTVETYRTVFAGDDCWGSDDWFFAWRGHGDGSFAAGEIAEATIEAFGRRVDGAWERTSNPHVQRHYPQELVRELLEAAGLRCLGVSGQFRDGSLEPGTDELRHTKFIYVCTPA